MRARIVTIGVLVVAVAASCGGGKNEARETVPPRTSSPSPSGLTSCPTEHPLEPGPDRKAKRQAIAAARPVVPKLFGGDTRGFVVEGASPARRSDGVPSINICGKELGDKTWVVYVTFPREFGASVGDGQLYVARFDSGWKVWNTY